MIRADEEDTTCEEDVEGMATWIRAEVRQAMKNTESCLQVSAVDYAARVGVAPELATACQLSGLQAHVIKLLFWLRKSGLVGDRS